MYMHVLAQTLYCTCILIKQSITTQYQISYQMELTNLHQNILQKDIFQQGLDLLETNKKVHYIIEIS